MLVDLGRLEEREEGVARVADDKRGEFADLEECCADAEDGEVKPRPRPQHVRRPAQVPLKLKFNSKISNNGQPTDVPSTVKNPTMARHFPYLCERNHHYAAPAQR